MCTSRETSKAMCCTAYPAATVTSASIHRITAHHRSATTNSPAHTAKNAIIRKIHGNISA